MNCLHLVEHDVDDEAEDDCGSYPCCHYALCIARFGPGMPGLHVASHMFLCFDVVNAVGGMEDVFNSAGPGSPFRIAVTMQCGAVCQCLREVLRAEARPFEQRD